MYICKYKEIYKKSMKLKATKKHNTFMLLFNPPPPPPKKKNTENNSTYINVLFLLNI